MTYNFTDGRLDIMIATPHTPSHRIVYVLYPLDDLGDWIQRAADRYALNIVSVTGMDWDDDLTPWPAKGVPAGSHDFAGDAPKLLKHLQSVIIPRVESRVNIPQPLQRDLLGVSLSGLFTLWQWMLCDTFRNIALLSGSFWYENFVPWLDHELSAKADPAKPGRVYMLLGKDEGKTAVPQFRTIPQDTARVEALLRNHGIPVHFDSVPGNHYANPLQRLDLALRALPAY